MNDLYVMPNMLIPHQDIQMPLCGGFEATEIIRKYESEMGLSRTPIVALTAHAMVGDREMCLAHQMDVSILDPNHPACETNA